MKGHNLPPTAVLLKRLSMAQWQVRFLAHTEASEESYHRHSRLHRKVPHTWNFDCAQKKTTSSYSIWVEKDW